MIESSVKNQLGGVYDMHWPQEGLICEMRLPAQHFSKHAAPSIDESDDMDAIEVAPVSPKGRRVLVLDDEPLVAMMLSDALKKLGAIVVGPFGAISEARKSLNEPLDAALLDVNVNGEMVFPFAADLRARGVPVAFVTGY